MITIPGLVRALATSPRTAGRPAILSDEVVTFEQLYARSRARVAELSALGVGRGSIVAVLCYNETYVFEYLVAAGHLGAALMPVSPALTDPELSALIEKADAAICLVSPAAVTHPPDKLTALTGRTCLVVTPAGEPEAVDELPIPAADSTCWVSPTGGSTGTPRLFAISHERLLTGALLNAYEWRWSGYAFHLAISPIAHGIGFSHAVAQLATGGAVALVERYSPELAARWLRDPEQPAWTAVVPTMIHDMEAYAAATDSTYEGLGLVVSAGAPLVARLRDRVLSHAGRRLIEYYGSTELGWMTWMEHRSGDPRNGIVGMPMLGTEVRVVDGDGQSLPAGDVGRIEKRGRPYAIPLSGGASAYEANVSAWESSGDVGWIEPDGLLVVSGRADDMLVVGGQNVYPVEVENVIREHPMVREVVVRGRESPRLGQQVVAIVELNAPQPPDFVDQVQALCARRLAKYKRPAEIVVLDVLPRNSAGKLSRSFDLAPHV